MRIGFGYDVHPFAAGRPLILGGIHIPWDRGLLGHSDADVLLHAIMDALLGAAALGDIGTHFPDTDPRYRNISSLLLLQLVRSKLEQAGYGCNNLDCTLLAEAPKIKPYIPAMTACIGKALGIEENQVSIKATTNEKMGFVGREEGMAAYAVCSIKTLGGKQDERNQCLQYPIGTEGAFDS
ncbi:MAG TPA: 2-C-methyl-D-erythritol 2,4-cyclodiphosphate synthase [Peptococcaceae bacterium]|nr:2-C-methyl-D-erythritol 2,4-cyclodiphosphate synthase [Peptococcaceae bacterium]